MGGEVELENTSAGVLEVPLQMSPFQHLNLVVTDSSGREVSHGHYGNRFSPLETPYTWRLKPGEKFVGNVSLLGNVPKEKQLPGTYVVRALYDGPAGIAMSEPLQIQLLPADQVVATPILSAGAAEGAAQQDPSSPG
jgi:hypothetical protein